MALGQLPPWLDVSPQHFMSALEAGGRIGVALSDQRQRAADAQANRRLQQEAMQSEMAMKQMALEDEAQRQQSARELDIAQLMQGNRRLDQQEAYQTGREERLGQYNDAKLLLDKEALTLDKIKAMSEAGKIDRLLVSPTPPGFIRDPATGAIHQDPTFNQNLYLAEKYAEKAKAYQDEGDVERYQQYMALANEQKGKWIGPRRTLQVGLTDGGLPQVTMDEGVTPYGTSDSSKPTIATASKAQEREMGLKNSMVMLNDVRNSMNKDSVGIRGTVGDFIDQYGPQANDLLGVGPKKPNLDRVSWRTKANYFSQHLLRQIQEDPDRFSKPERDEIKRITDMLAVSKNEDYIKTQFDALQTIIKNRVRTYSDIQGKPAPDWSLSGEEIKSRLSKLQSDLNTAVTNRRMTPAQASEAYARAKKSAIDTVQRFNIP